MKITVEFFGGPHGGTVTFEEPLPGEIPLASEAMFAWFFYSLTSVQSTNAEREARTAECNVSTTRGGEAGSEAGATGHRYRVAERRTDLERVYVRAEYCPELKVAPTSSKLWDTSTIHQFVEELMRRGGFLRYLRCTEDGSGLRL